MFEKPEAVEIYDLVDALHSCKQASGKSVSAHVLEMKGYMDQLHALGKSYNNDMAINLINRSLNKDFGDFVRNFNMHCVGKTVTELHVDKTPYEIWHGKAPNLSYLKVWGCEEYVKRDSADKLYQRSVKCIFVEYPKETMGYYFYFPPENKVIVASEIPVESESLGSPSELIPVCRSERTTRAPNRICLNIEVEDDDVGDLGEPANYKAAMLDPDKVIWQGKMDEEMNSMKVMKVWIVVDLPPNAKVVRSKWLYRKKTDMHDEDIYMEQTEGYVDPKYQNRVCKLQRSIYGLKQASRQWNKQFDEEIKNQSAYIDKILMKYNMHNSKKGYLPMEVKHDLRNKLCASTPKEVAYMKKVPYASANPGKLHWVAVKHILKYSRNTRDIFLVYRGKPNTKLDVISFCDASLQCDKDDTKSQTGYVFVVNGGAVDYTTIAMHSVQAEYVAASEAIMEAI
nr:hypothetical protein [Tanacetum cinerariifolium]